MLPTVSVTDIFKFLAQLARNRMAEEPQLAPSCHGRPWNMTKTVPPVEACDYEVDQEARASDDQAYTAEQCHGSRWFVLVY